MSSEVRGGRRHDEISPAEFLTLIHTKKEHKTPGELEAAILKFQRGTPYHGFPYDDVIEWRMMVRAVKAATESWGPDEVTLPWVCTGCPDAARKGPVEVRVSVRLGAWSPGPHRFRYAYLSFEVV